MEHFEAPYDEKAIERASVSLRVMVGAGLALMIVAFGVYALMLSHLDIAIHVAVITVVLISGLLALRVSEVRIKRFRGYTGSSMPAIIFNRRGIWIHERTGGHPIPWGALSKVEKVGRGRNRALRLHTEPRDGKPTKPIVIPGDLYAADIGDITEALEEFKDIFTRREAFK